MDEMFTHRYQHNTAHTLCEKYETHAKHYNCTHITDYQYVILYIAVVTVSLFFESFVSFSLVFRIACKIVCSLQMICLFTCLVIMKH